MAEASQYRFQLDEIDDPRFVRERALDLGGHAVTVAVQRLALAPVSREVRGGELHAFYPDLIPFFSLRHRSTYKTPARRSAAVRVAYVNGARPISSPRRRSTGTASPYLSTSAGSVSTSIVPKAKPFEQSTRFFAEVAVGPRQKNELVGAGHGLLSAETPPAFRAGRGGLALHR
jgi:hypothetical protein